MKRSPKTELDYVSECKYISTIVERIKLKTPNALRNFNDDSACFIRYCELQQRLANEDGFYDTVEYIQQCIDEVQL